MKNATKLTVQLHDRSYPIFIGIELLAKIGKDIKHRNIGNRYAIIADDIVAALYAAELCQSLKDSGLEYTVFSFPHGEVHKNIHTFSSLISQIAQVGFDRHDAIISLGGGVSGDIAGYVAASYMRGIPFIQVPTTLLAQVDSAVGGKTGVDIPEGKNLVGAFYQPQVVYADISVLQTLPEEELRGGLAEVIKYGVINDADFFYFLQKEYKHIVQLVPEKIETVITTCCTIKAKIVVEDERESGIRQILNFGHTIGHAVEAASDFRLIHGFAVAIGMAAAARLAVNCGILTAQECDRIITLLQKYGLPIEIPQELDRTEIKKFLRTDKKNRDGKVFYILPTAIGKTAVTSEISTDQLDAVLR